MAGERVLLRAREGADAPAHDLADAVADHDLVALAVDRERGGVAADGEGDVLALLAPVLQVGGDRLLAAERVQATSPPSRNTSCSIAPVCSRSSPSLPPASAPRMSHTVTLPRRSPVAKNRPSSLKAIEVTGSRWLSSWRVSLGALRSLRSHRSTMPLAVPTTSQRPSGPSAATLPAPELERHLPRLAGAGAVVEDDRAGVVDGDDVPLVAADVGVADRRVAAADDAAALAREGDPQRPLGVGLARARAVGGAHGPRAGEDRQLGGRSARLALGQVVGALHRGVDRACTARRRPRAPAAASLSTRSSWRT